MCWRIGVHLVGPHLSYTDPLQYKALIMLEGNDISSGLKWALYSNSVVLMQRVTCTSWAMEELLEPRVRYIPFADDLCDVEEKVQWELDHDEKAQQIAHSGSLWISDLVYHPDEERIIDESIHRYKQHFVLNPTLHENHVLSLYLYRND
jgi:Glycosyl transferase family 90